MVLRTELPDRPGPGAPERSAAINALTPPGQRGLWCAALRTAEKTAGAGPCVKPEVRTLMTVAAMGAAHKPKIIVPTPVATG